MRLRRFIFLQHNFIRMFQADTPAALVRPAAFVRVVKNPLPSDAEIVRVYCDHVGRITFVVSSAEFDLLEDGAEIPEHPSPQFELVVER